MSSLIKNLRIQNFKSVRDLSLECERINIFIGKPNAGKSNILEAISLLGAGYSEGRFMEGAIRYDRIAEMFTEFEFKNNIKVSCGDVGANLSFVAENEFKIEVRPYLSTNLEDGTDVLASPFSFYSASIALSGQIKISFKNSNELEIVTENHSLLCQQFAKGRFPVKKYVFDFQKLNTFQENGLFLHPPYGDNFYLIIRSHKELREEIQQFLKPNGLKLLLDEGSKLVSVVRETEDSFISFPLHLVPDTFQRYIFHLAAIMSNRDSVLLFEEPESHSYAPYVYQLAQHILDDEGGNQYFITTHNPYLLTPILQEGKKEVALFVTWFEDYQTHVRRLSEEEIGDILNYGMDIFLNLDNFIPV